VVGVTRIGSTLLSGIVALAGIAALALGAQARAVPSASRVIDRTLSCETGLTGGLHEIWIRSNSAYGQGANRPVGEAELLSNIQPSGRLVWLAQAGLEVSPACMATKATVPLTPRGLTGGVVGQIEERVACESTRRVLLHVRAVFRSPVTLRRGQPYGFPLLYAHSPVSSGSFAVRTSSGKPLLYSTVLPSGSVKAFAALPLTCTAD
jgi:hypothetical protein